MSPSNETVRRAVESNVRAEAKVSAWLGAHAQDSNPPVRFAWAPWSGPLRDSLEDVIVTFADGTKRIATPADLADEG